MRRDAPELRIIDDAVWMTAHRRLEEARASYLWMARSRDNGSGRKFGYLCGYHPRGRTVCVNGLEAPMESTDDAVLASIERDLLRPDVVERETPRLEREIRSRLAD